MLRRLALAALAVAATCAPVGAQTVDVPRPYAIPLPPTSEPSFG